MTDRRAFLQFMALAASGLLAPAALRAQQSMEQFYDLPEFGNVSVLHITDLQAQWKPLYYREPSVQIGSASEGAVHYVTGDALLEYYNLMIGSAQAYAFSSADYIASAKDYGMLGGVACLAALIGILRKSRKHAWLLDGGNGNCQSSAPWATAEASAAITTALSANFALPDAKAIALMAELIPPGPNHEPALRSGQQAVALPQPTQSQYIAHNISHEVTGKPGFAPYVLQNMHGVSVAIIGQAAHNEPLNADHAGNRVVQNESANVKDRPGEKSDKQAVGGADAAASTSAAIELDEPGLQKTVNEARQKGARVVLLLSRAGVDADLKLAARVTGIDVILGGRSATPLPEPVTISNRKGKTLVTNAGAQGRFLAVLDMKVGKKGVTDFRYNLLPVVQSFLQPDKAMAGLVDKAYAQAPTGLSEKLATSNGLLYRRGSFNGTWDEWLLQAMLQETGAQIALYPGYRWGPVLLPDSVITREDVIGQTALGATQMFTHVLSGRQIQELLEEAADDVFNHDAYKRSALDMMRTGGLQYRIYPDQVKGRRIANVIIGKTPMQPDEKYKVAAWGLQSSLEAGVAAANATVQAKSDAMLSNSLATGPLLVQDVLEKYLGKQKVIPAIKPYKPEIVGLDDAT